MRICFVTGGTLKEFLKRYQEEKDTEKCEPQPKTDLFIFGFGCLGEVSYERELKGETSDFEDAAKLSKISKAVVVCGCITDTRGHKRKSALVAENGRLKGVSDMLHAVDREVSSGAALRIYDTQIGRLGIAVAEDLHFPEVARSLSICGSDFIVCPFGIVKHTLHNVLLRAYAYLYGTPILFCGVGQCIAVDGQGNLVFSSPMSPVCVDFKSPKEYHLTETRRRGFF